jgi:YHS domain-containing protein
MTRRNLLVTALAVLFLAAVALPLALAEDKAPTPYPLDYCLVSGEKLGEHGAPVVKVHDGQEFKFCCKSCVKDFDKDPAKWHAKLKEEVAKQNQNKKG